MLIRLKGDLSEIGIDPNHYKTGDIVEAVLVEGLKGLVEIPMPGRMGFTYYISSPYFDHIRIIKVPL